MSDVKMKVCNPNVGCGLSYPATKDNFHVNSSNKDGLSGKCKSCCNAYSKKRYQATKGRSFDHGDREYVHTGCWMNGDSEIYL